MIVLILYGLLWDAGEGPRFNNSFAEELKTVSIKIEIELNSDCYSTKFLPECMLTRMKTSMCPLCSWYQCEHAS